MTDILVDEKNRLLCKLMIFEQDKNKETNTTQLLIIENKIKEITERLQVLDELITGKDIKELFLNYSKEIEKIKRRYFYLQSLHSVLSN
jgi:hypothetical protein